MMSSTENVVTDKENKGGWLSIIPGGITFHSSYKCCRGIHSVRHTQGVHILHTEGMGQPWAQHQQNAFRSKQVHGEHRGIRSVRRIQGVHILHTEGKGQHQPLAQPQPHACHNIYILDHVVHNIQWSSQGVPIHIHHTEGKGQHQPLAQPQPHACHSSYILDHVRSIHHSLHNQDVLHILRKEDKDQPWAWPQAQQRQQQPSRQY